MPEHPIPDGALSMEPTKLEFVIAGDSHIFSMGAPQGYNGPVALSPIETLGHGYFLMENWRGGRGGPYYEALVKHAEGRAAVLVVMGNQHFGNFLLQRTPLFDFVDPSEPSYDVYPDAVVVPRRMVKASPALSSQWLRALIPQLWAHGCRCVIVVGTPPVRADFGDYVEEIRKHDFWRDKANIMGVDIATCRFTPAPIMKRLWGVLQESLADAARDAGAQFMAVPKEAVDTDGYLSAKYRGPLSDFTHANHAYGRLILEHIQRVVAKAETESMPPVTRSDE
jgi:hypothetical protein